MSQDKHEAKAAEQVPAAFKKLGRAVVERNRSISVPCGSVPAGFIPESGRVVMKPEFKTFKDGQEVELPVEEIATLRARGFLVDPDKKAPEKQEGAKVTRI